MLSFRVRETGRGTRITALLKAPKQIRPIARAALAQSLSEYARGEGRYASVTDRFGRSGGALYGFRMRSPGYVRRQTRDLRLRGPAAFVSPRNIPVRQLISAVQGVASARGGAATMLASSRALSAVAAQSRPHMRDLVTKPGIGHQIRSSGSTRINLTLTWPGARVLNTHPVYADEFRDLTKGGNRDWRAILRRAREIFDDHIRAINRGAAARASMAAGVTLEAA
jgi:hypothetical protein